LEKDAGTPYRRVPSQKALISLKCVGNQLLKSLHR